MILVTRCFSAVIWNQIRLKAFGQCLVHLGLEVNIVDEFDFRCERVARYRKMADAAHAAASAAKTVEARDAYIGIALAWSALADQVEGEEPFVEPRETIPMAQPDFRYNPK